MRQLLRDIEVGDKKGIIFVKQIALLYPLAHLCEQDNYRVAVVGGTSSTSEKDRNQVRERKFFSVAMLVLLS